MPVIIQYLLKLSLSVAVIHAFYYLFLRRLTFYNLNRWYLLGYMLLCFIIPFINVAGVADKADKALPVINYIPSVQHLNGYYAHATEQHIFTIWNVALCLLAIGAVVLLVRMAIQLGSFLRIKNKAVVISDKDTVIYHVDEQIAPFSFGNSIYLNKDMHTDRELEEIILHEYVHVKQRHTIDILLAELLCVVNWYNPFAWFMRHSIRQNLEFIADDNVVRSGMDRKAYQYHLLKVVGIPQYRIANQFNFSSLKKRIMMMNRAKTAKIHLVKFLFILPLMAVTLLAFRSEISTSVAKSKVMQATIKTLLPASVTRVIQGNIINERSSPAKDTLIKAAVNKKLTVENFNQTQLSAADSTIVDKRSNVVTLYGNATLKNLTGTVSGPVILATGGTSGNLDFSKALVTVDGKISSADNIEVAKIASVTVLRSKDAMARFGNKGKYGALLYNMSHDTSGAYTATIYGDTLLKTKPAPQHMVYGTIISSSTSTAKGGGTQGVANTSSPGNSWSVGLKPANSLTTATTGYGTQGSANTSSVSTWSVGLQPGSSSAVAAKGQGTRNFSATSSPGNSWSIGVKPGNSGSSWSIGVKPGMAMATGVGIQSETSPSGHPTATASVNPSAVIEGSVLATGENDIMYIIDPKQIELSHLNSMTRFFKENGFLLNFGEQYQAGKLQKLTVSIAIDNFPKTPSASATYDIDQMQDGKYVIRVLADRKTKDVSVVSIPRKGK